MEKNKNRQIFRIAFLVFLAIVLYFLYNMASQTTAPWNKKKAIENKVQ